MANSSRLEMNRDGQMLIPMNVDGGSLDGKFIDSTKLCILLALVGIDAGIIAWTTQVFMGVALKIIIYLILFWFTQYIFRYFILEEKYYYRMYKKMEQYAVSNPSVFWGIASIRDTEDGAIMMYGDGKAGILMRLERDTITGKNKEFRETHFDAISDFYKELNLKNLEYITMSVMEPAGKDPRLTELDKLTVKSDNKNIRKLLEAEVGYIKTMTRSTLFESDYVLIVCNNPDRADMLIHEAVDCAYRLLEGGFVGYSILDGAELIDRLKDEYGVKYFDYSEATVSLYRNSGLNIGKALNISSITYTDGSVDEVGNMENMRLETLASYKNRGLLENRDWTVRSALRGNILEGRFSRDKVVGFDSIESNNVVEKVQDIDSEIFGFDADEQDSGFIEDLLYMDITNGNSSKHSGILSKIVKKMSKEDDEDSKGIENKKESKKRGRKKGKKKGVEERGIQSEEHSEFLIDSSGENFQREKDSPVEIDIDSFSDDDFIDLS